MVQLLHLGARTRLSSCGGSDSCCVSARCSATSDRPRLRLSVTSQQPIEFCRTENNAAAPFETLLICFMILAFLTAVYTIMYMFVCCDEILLEQVACLEQNSAGRPRQRAQL